MEEHEARELREVRVRYSTIINYVSHIYRLAIAVLFALIVTRRLSVDEYGLLTTIIGLAAAFSAVYEVWNFWIVRFNARKKYELVSSSLFLNVIYAPIAIALFLLVSSYYAGTLGVSSIYFYAACPLILAALGFGYFRALALSSKPFIEGEVLIAEHTIRIALAYVLVGALSLRLLGALATVTIVAVSGVAIYYSFLRKHGVRIPGLKFDGKSVSTTFKNGYISAISTLHEFLRQVERPLLTMLTGSTTATAYVGVSYVPRSVILQSSASFTASLSARLLRKPIREDIEDILRISLIVNGCLLLIMVMFSDSILSLFRPEYVEAKALLILFSLESFAYVFLNTLISVASSIERDDLEKSGLELARTSLFRLRALSFLAGVISIALASATTSALLALGFQSPTLLSLPYPSLWLLTTLLLTVYSYRDVSKKIEFSVPWREATSSLIAGLLTYALLNIAGVSSVIIYSFWRDFPKLLIFAVVAAALYFSIVLALSKWFRGFLKIGISYLLCTLKRHRILKFKSSN